MTTNNRTEPQASKGQHDGDKRTSTRYQYQQKWRGLKSSAMKARAQIPPIFGTATFVLAAIATKRTPVRTRDISACLGEGAERTAMATAHSVGVLRTFRMKTVQGNGPRPVALMFDDTFPLAREVRVLARKIGTTHPLPLETTWPNEAPPAHAHPAHDLNHLFGSEANLLVLATARALRGKVGRVETEAAVPYDSLVAVERANRRLRQFGILNEHGTALADAPWKKQLEKLLDGYLRLHPEIREQIRERSAAKRQHKINRSTETLFGYNSTQRVLITLAVHGPMTRARLRSITMMTHENTALNPLINAGVLAVESRMGDTGSGTRAHGTRKRLVVGLNAAVPVYAELRAVLLALDEPATRRPAGTRDVSSPQPTYDIMALLSTAPLIWALLMMNAVAEGELDVASLHRLRPQHAKFTLHNRMGSLLDQGFVTARQQGLVLYYRLNPNYPLYHTLKPLLDRIGEIWPDMVEAAAVNDQLKPARRLVQDRNARKKAAEKRG